MKSIVFVVLLVLAAIVAEAKKSEYLKSFRDNEDTRHKGMRIRGNRHSLNGKLNFKTVAKRAADELSSYFSDEEEDPLRFGRSVIEYSQ
ncbi:unnamed protein product [Bursaphelenchus okinawaensis]|uniref:Uncharacterized protein n=1 Tax=Bursaphelenchus okinawaensis TaxID=465554 RepID=A0A811KN54_9BILA|nr:unnamed protein product [Bursaphelenchus okinawaensis]CAG9107042.1 unnamed protein product [Bursaphelenchus okinawaensis]